MMMAAATADHEAARHRLHIRGQRFIESFIGTAIGHTAATLQQTLKVLEASKSVKRHQRQNCR